MSEPPAGGQAGDHFDAQRTAALMSQVQITLPAWISKVDATRRYSDVDSQVGLAIELSRLNVSHRSGGPFGAAVFDAGGRLLGVGVNRVVPTHCSAAHAEVLALATCQQGLQRYRLNETGERITLASSSQPCSMCFGAVLWSGIDELLIAARADDVETLSGFDEGPLPVAWESELARRGITVQADVLRDEACEILRRYGQSGVVY